MSTHNICFRGEIRKISDTLWLKKKTSYLKLCKYFFNIGIRSFLIILVLIFKQVVYYMLMGLKLLGRPRWLSWMRVRLVIRTLRVRPPQGRQHSFVEIDREIFSTVILSLSLIQEGQRKNVHNTC